MYATKKKKKKKKKKKEQTICNNYIYILKIIFRIIY